MLSIARLASSACQASETTFLFWDPSSRTCVARCRWTRCHYCLRRNRYGLHLCVCRLRSLILPLASWTEGPWRCYAWYCIPLCRRSFGRPPTFLRISESLTLILVQQQISFLDSRSRLSPAKCLFAYRTPRSWWAFARWTQRRRRCAPL